MYNRCVILVVRAEEISKVIRNFLLEVKPVTLPQSKEDEFGKFMVVLIERF